MVIDKYFDKEKHKFQFVLCVERKMSKYDYPNCEYNNGKEMAPWTQK